MVRYLHQTSVGISEFLADGTRIINWKKPDKAGLPSASRTLKMPHRGNDDLGRGSNKMKSLPTSPVLFHPILHEASSRLYPIGDGAEKRKAEEYLAAGTGKQVILSHEVFACLIVFSHLKD